MNNIQQVKEDIIKAINNPDTIFRKYDINKSYPRFFFTFRVIGDQIVDLEHRAMERSEFEEIVQAADEVRIVTEHHIIFKVTVKLDEPNHIGLVYYVLASF